MAFAFEIIDVNYKYILVSHVYLVISNTKMFKANGSFLIHASYSGNSETYVLNNYYVVTH